MHRVGALPIPGTPLLPSPGEPAAAAEVAPVRWPYRAAVLVTLGAFNLLTFNRYFPLSEGWWETYGYLYNSGLRPYRDFDLAFTPLFTIINAGLLQLFGDSFFALRLFGVGVFLTAVFLLQLLLEQFVSPRSAAVAALVATFFVIFEPQFIAKDYHLYQLLFVALSLLLHVWLAGNARLTARQRLGWTLLLGMTATVVFLLKQNVGGLLLVAIPASLPLVERERPFARVIAFGLGAAIALVLTLPIVSPSDWRQLLLANDAKGSLGTVLGRVWENPLNRDPLTLALKMAGAYALARYLFAPPARWRGVWSDSFQAVYENRTVRNLVFFAMIVVVAASGHRIRNDLTPWIIPVTLALLLIGVGRVARGMVDRTRDVDPRLAAIVLPMLALAYANTMTAAFDFNGMHVAVALAIGWTLATVERWTARKYWFAAALVFLIVVPEIFAAKLRIPYAWWGHRQASAFSAVEQSEYPQLRGMYVTPRYRDMLNTIKRAVDTYSQSSTDVFFYNLPVFYWLHGKLPPFRTVVHWFDVVSSKRMDADVRAIQDRPPRLIVAMEPLPAAYTGHRALKKSARLPQEDFRDLMDEWVASRKYRLVRSIAVPNGTLEGCDVTLEVVVQHERSIGLTLEAAVAAAGPVADGLRVRRGPRDEPILAAAGAAPEAPGVMRAVVRKAPSDADAPLAAGDVLTVGGDYARVQALSEILGVARGEPRDWHAVHVYVREDAAGTAVGLP